MRCAVALQFNEIKAKTFVCHPKMQAIGWWVDHTSYPNDFLNRINFVLKKSKLSTKCQICWCTLYCSAHSTFAGPFIHIRKRKRHGKKPQLIFVLLLYYIIDDNSSWLRSKSDHRITTNKKTNSWWEKAQKTECFCCGRKKMENKIQNSQYDVAWTEQSSENFSSFMRGQMESLQTSKTKRFKEVKKNRKQFQTNSHDPLHFYDHWLPILFSWLFC